MAGRTILRLYTETAYKMYAGCVFLHVAWEAFTESLFLMQNSALKALKNTAIMKRF